MQKMHLTPLSNRRSSFRYKQKEEKEVEQEVDDEDQRRFSYFHALHLILPASLFPQKDVSLDPFTDAQQNKIPQAQPESNENNTNIIFPTVDNSKEKIGERSQTLKGYKTLQELRDKVANYRLNYLNWRKFKPKGAKGETTDVFTSNLLTEHAPKLEESLLNYTNLLSRESTIDENDRSASQNIVRVTSLVMSPVSPDGSVEIKPADVCDLTKKKSTDHEAWLRFYYNPFTPAETAPVAAVRMNNLDQLRSRGVRVPEYSREPSTVTHWILHIGVGQFHRSHQLTFMDDLLAQQFKQNKNNTPVKWGYCGIGLMPSDLKMAKALRNQDLLYSVISRTNTTCSVQIVGSMFDYIFAHEEYEKAYEKLLSPNVYIISLTITEKGYFQNIKGGLDTENELIQHDINLMKTLQTSSIDTCPRTAIGFLYWALYLRRKNNLPPIAIMSCDNVSENGHVAKRMVLSFAKLLDLDIANWIDANIKFPSTMVDRITPATVLEHCEILAEDFGVLDQWPVVTEEFKQWAIEDSFPVRPTWEQVGALMVSDVRPLELMKLRLLNGGHSIVGYISYLAGYSFVDDAVNDVRISSFLRAYMDEMTSTIKNVSVELERYKEKIVERFGNRMIKDRLLRLCEDGSTKLYNTIKDAITELLMEQRPVYTTAHGLAAFIYFLATTSPDLILDSKKTMLIDLAKKAVDSVRDPRMVSNFLMHIFGSVAEDICLVNYVSLALYAMKQYSVEQVLHCGGSVQTLLDSHFRSPAKYKAFLEFATQ